MNGANGANVSNGANGYLEGGAIKSVRKKCRVGRKKAVERMAGQCTEPILIATDGKAAPSAITPREGCQQAFVRVPTLPLCFPPHGGIGGWGA